MAFTLLIDGPACARPCGQWCSAPGDSDGLAGSWPLCGQWRSVPRDSDAPFASWRPCDQWHGAPPRSAAELVAWPVGRETQAKQPCGLRDGALSGSPWSVAGWFFARVFLGHDGGPARRFGAFPPKLGPSWAAAV